MANYPTSGSTLSSQISTGLSTQIIIKVGTETVGAVQNLSVTHTRGLYRTKEVGLDGVLEIVPNSPTEYSLEVERIVFDRLRLPEAFARGFINIKSQLVPFDILVIDRTNGDGDGAIVHRFVNCWFNNYRPRYQAGDFIITESASIYCEDISTTVGSGDGNAADGGARHIKYDVNERERMTDRGSGSTSTSGSTTGSGFRGTMDVEGLINQTFER